MVNRITFNRPGRYALKNRAYCAALFQIIRTGMPAWSWLKSMGALKTNPANTIVRPGNTTYFAFFTDHRFFLR